MYMFDSDTAAQLDAIGKLGFTNPFGASRPALEAMIVGEGVARSAPWNRSLDWPLRDPAITAITEEAERQITAIQAALLRGAKPDPRERALIGGVALYVLYYRYDERFYSLITAEARSESVAFYESFERDYQELFARVEPPAWASDPGRLFALFFQLRRAFHFVFHQILGTSAAASRLRETVWESLFTHDPWRYLAHLQGRMHEASTLILGPTGTGKELVASAIGFSSFIPFDPARRRFARSFTTAFHPMHLAAMSKQLIESELFGHKRGAFTGAIADRMGHLEGRSASETIFLDEIGELDGEVQVKLLRVLQSRTFHRLGDSEPRKFGGKVIAATHRNLSRALREGSFREDLYYRLCSDVIKTPSLYEQLLGEADELHHLVAVLIQRSLGTCDPTTLDEIMGGIERSVGFDYEWPGNMRELEQCVRSLLIHGRYLPPRQPEPRAGLEPLFQQMRTARADLEEVVSEYSRWVYAREGSYARAGRVLGVDRRTVAKHVGEPLDASNPVK
jgi:transcriptional regulator with AAA-type ATPase domain